MLLIGLCSVNLGEMAIQQAGKDSRMMVLQRSNLVVAKDELTGKFHKS